MKKFIVFFCFILFVFVFKLLNDEYRYENAETEENVDDDANIKLTPKHLRDMFTETIISDQYDEIREAVIATAIIGFTHFDFTIMCMTNHYNICHDYNGYEAWYMHATDLDRFSWNSVKNGIRYKQSEIGILLENNTRYKQIKTRVLQKIQSSFPGSNITKVYKGCCVTYTISW